MNTGTFWNSGNKPEAVNIARYPPKWYTGKSYSKLAPPAWIIKHPDWKEMYRKLALDKLDPDTIYREIVELAGENAILLCYEKDPAECHRGLVAEWFRETLGIHLPDIETGKSVEKPKNNTLDAFF